MKVNASIEDPTIEPSIPEVPRKRKNKKKKRGSLVEGDGVQTGAKQVEDGATCKRCGLWVERSNARTTGKQKQIWICKVCNSKSASLYKIYGKWPPKRFKELPKDRQEKFWQGLKDKYGWSHIEAHVTETIKVANVDQFGEKTSGKYLPLSV